MILYGVFIVVYVSMVSLQLQIPTANLMRNTVTKALQTPTFDSLNGVTGAPLKGTNFHPKMIGFGESCFYKIAKKSSDALLNGLARVWRPR